ncbi:hypothetical protein B0H14DRAFT_3623551, partial [Mycena olivaceomarginata]
LLFHNKHATFTCEGQPSTRSLTEVVRATIGENGGVLATAMSHGCVECTHIKRYRSDLINEGVVLGADLDDVAGIAASANDNNAPELAADDAVDQLGSPHQQAAPQAGTPRGYIRLAVMDGKTIQHCLHIAWQQQYNNRFSRLSFPGIQRVIRHQQTAADNGGVIPALRIELGPLGDTPGDQVVHTFRAKSTYCLQTAQWACGFPIGWGKCYRSESPPQVLAILDRIWLDHPESNPSFVAYDDACSLLRHIVTQDPHSAWLRTTKFVVDAWHYIGHRATDILCRLWCNPAPMNGSQPDLILVEEDANGTKHQTRAFNTKTAEQLNSWLNGFESQLRQMSDVNYDFFIHVLMMIYAKRVKKQVDTKDLGLSDEFWAEATGKLDGRDDIKAKKFNTAISGAVDTLAVTAGIDATTAEACLDTIVVKPLDIALAGGKTDTVWNIYFTAPPTLSLSHYLMWTQAARGIKYETDNFGTGVARTGEAQFGCGGCGSYDHPVGLCWAPRLVGWFGEQPKSTTSDDATLFDADEKTERNAGPSGSKHGPKKGKSGDGRITKKGGKAQRRR